MISERPSSNKKKLPDWSKNQPLDPSKLGSCGLSFASNAFKLYTYTIRRRISRRIQKCNKSENSCIKSNGYLKLPRNFDPSITSIYDMHLYNVFCHVRRSAVGFIEDIAMMHIITELYKTWRKFLKLSNPKPSTRVF